MFLHNKNETCLHVPVYFFFINLLTVMQAMMRAMRRTIAPTAQIPAMRGMDQSVVSFSSVGSAVVVDSTDAIPVTNKERHHEPL